jgi:hypothetical protein
VKSVCEAEKQISRQLNGLQLMRLLRRKIDSRIEPYTFREKDFDISNSVSY